METIKIEVQMKINILWREHWIVQNADKQDELSKLDSLSVFLTLQSLCHEDYNIKGSRNELIKL